ncbi:MAG: STAS domain-containing protein [Angustibacter sp.]
MTEPPARLDLDYRRDGWTVASFFGEVDLSNVEQLEEQLLAGTRSSSSLVIDLSALDYLDSQGVRMLRRAVQRTSTHGEQHGTGQPQSGKPDAGHPTGAPRLVVVAPQGSIAHDLITLTNAVGPVPVVSTVKAAIDEIAWPVDTL